MIQVELICALIAHRPHVQVHCSLVFDLSLMSLITAVLLHSKFNLLLLCNKHSNWRKKEILTPPHLLANQVGREGQPGPTKGPTDHPTSHQQYSNYACQHRSILPISSTLRFTQQMQRGKVAPNNPLTPLQIQPSIPEELELETSDQVEASYLMKSPLHILTTYSTTHNPTHDYSKNESNS